MQINYFHEIVLSDIVQGLILKTKILLHPQKNIGFMVYFVSLVHQLPFKKHYPFQNVSERPFKDHFLQSVIVL